jgi:phosphoenolpyruvate carboxylase
MAEDLKGLPRELKNLVGRCVAILGDVIREEGGQNLFKQVESVRQKMTAYRGASSDEQYQILDQSFKQIEKIEANDRHSIAHSFSLMLELINTCEAAYRTFRLQRREKPAFRNRQDNAMVYVLTAHPTEARTSANIELFGRIKNVAIRILDKSGEQEYLESIIKHNLKLAWLLPVTKHEKPRVVDEANHLFSIIMRPDIFNTILRADRDLGKVRIRTWVGGDKDGHPGVDEKTLLECLNVSRSYFFSFIQQVLVLFNQDIELIGEKKLGAASDQLTKSLKKLQELGDQDDIKLIHFTTNLKKLSSLYQDYIGAVSPRLQKIQNILQMFPALVIPLELREDSGVLAEALVDKKPLAIKRMLIKLKKIAGKGLVQSYAQGLIISMCHSYTDILNAMKLCKQVHGQIELPIIPLFETAKALDLSKDIMKQLIQNKAYINIVKKRWNGQIEMMLGYSDSSKGMGVLASRVGIAKAIRQLDLIVSSAGLTPVFFHGSGGSVDRGGGSIKDQTAWWPKSALNIYKATIQGEMVERIFTSSEVAMSGMNKILENFDRAKSKRGTIKVNKFVEKFSAIVRAEYQEKLKQDEFFKMIEAATPYTYLSELKLGSRPAKRSTAKNLDLSSIRAIPWILCWTQTRILFPTWWGIGSAWKKWKKDPKQVEGLKSAYKESYLFASYLRVLGFTLSKVELPVFKLYLEKSELPEESKKKILKEFKTEYLAAIQFLRAISEKRNILWYRPWLADSITLRSPMIHPLNILQVLAYQDKDMVLLRKTVAGISSGMLTTG